MTAKTAENFIEFLEYKEALCRVVKEERHIFQALHRGTPFWASGEILKEFDSYAKRISECEDIPALRRQILTAPRVCGAELQNEIIKEANVQSQKLTFLRTGTLPRSPGMSDMSKAAAQPR
jgi:hypothetical protein